MTNQMPERIYCFLDEDHGEYFAYPFNARECHPMGSEYTRADLAQKTVTME